jgi:ribosomal protein L13E
MMKEMAKMSTSKRDNEKQKKVARPKSSEKKREESIAKEKEALKRQKPEGEVPVSLVNVRHRGLMKQRRARGYSWSELSSAGIAIDLAKRWDLPIDIRRRSLIMENVDRLRSWLKVPKKAKPSQRPRARKGIKAAESEKVSK